MGSEIILKESTMSSTQLAEILPYKRKEVNKKIRSMFGEKIARENFSPAYDAQDRVIDYFLPEKESKMFVAKHDIDYLEKVIEFWIDRSRSGGIQQIDWDNPKHLASIIQQSTAKVQEQKQVIQIQQEKIKEDKPKVEFYDEFSNGYGLFGLQNAARALHQAPNKFIGFLKQNYLFYQGGALVAKAKYIQMGLFEIKTNIVEDKPRPRTFMTNRGIQYFAKKLDEVAVA